MILDTKALSAFADDVAPVVEQVASADELHVRVIVLGEYRFGIAPFRRRQDYERWLSRGRSFWSVLPPRRRDRRALRVHSAATQGR